MGNSWTGIPFLSESGHSTHARSLSARYVIHGKDKAVKLNQIQALARVIAASMVVR
jgi:hypothetical protein